MPRACKRTSVKATTLLLLTLCGSDTGASELQMGALIGGSQNTEDLSQRPMSAEDPRIARALKLSGDDLRRSGAYAPAEKKYRQSLARYSELPQGYESEMTDVLVLLGSVYYSTERYQAGIDAFDQAMLLVRRTDGVESVKQLNILDWLTVSHIRNREPAKADAKQQLYYHISRANIGDDNPQLLPAMVKLADWYRMRGQLNNALFAFEEALNLIDRNQLSGLEKLGPMRGIADVMLRQDGMCCEVDTGPEELAKRSIEFSLSRQQYSADSPRLLAVLKQTADWMVSTGQLTAAIGTYEEALELVESDGLDSATRLEVLYGIFSARFLSGDCCSDDAMDEALNVVKRSAFSDHEQLEVLVHLADLHTLSQRQGSAEQYYEMAWQQMDRSDGVPDDYFGSPELLGVSRLEDVSEAYHESKAGGLWSLLNGDLTTASQPVVGSPLGLCRARAVQLAKAKSPRDLSDYYVDVTFTVESDGRVADISVEESNAPANLQKYVVNTLEGTRYRPALDEGDAVTTHNVTLHQTFATRSRVDTRINRLASDSDKITSMGCEILAMDV